MKGNKHGGGHGSEGWDDGNGPGGDEGEGNGNGEGCSLGGGEDGGGRGDFRRAPTNGNGP